MDSNEKTAKEKVLLIDKRYNCPICEKEFRSKAVKSNSAKFVDTMYDLRPIHSNINVTKYDAICCPNCGYAALPKNFATPTATQRNIIKEKIQSNFKSHVETECDIYTTEMAISRMKMVLLCTVTKGGKDSEIGNVCLKICWLYQDLADEVSEDDPDAAAKKELYMKEADNAGMKAYERLTSARMHEEYPIAGMNEPTLDYLLAYFAYKFGDNQTAMQFLSGVVSNRTISPRLKDKSLDLKDLINQSRENTNS